MPALALEAAAASDLVDARIDAACVHEACGENDDGDENQSEHDPMVSCRDDQYQSTHSKFRSAELIERTGAQRRSMTPAIAWPCPMHIVAIPYRP